MSVYLAEFIGTAILLLLGTGVVANVLLKQTKGHNSGLIIITAGWGFSVFAAVACVGDVSGAHLNPAVTIGLAVAGKFEWTHVGGYVVAQLAGAMVGAAIAWIFYAPHYAVTEDADAKLGTFCTAPAIRNLPHNVFCEAVGTFVLVYAVLMMVDPEFATREASTTVDVTIGLGSIGAVKVGLIVFVIGVALGGTTGYAINPARDLGPRIVHFLVPIPGKRDSDWSYSWVPVVGPILGGVLAAALFLAHGT
ncbi:MAG: aquaporin family protein [Planctomycetes bacterium]|nr:aquaporin family protein [Planctomycetota bacterium]